MVINGAGDINAANVAGVNLREQYSVTVVRGQRHSATASREAAPNATTGAYIDATFVDSTFPYLKTPLAGWLRH